MTRTAAREIAVHFAFELGFTNQTAEELLAEALNRKTFEQIGEEEPLYAEFPNEKQREYISKLVKGVYEHSPELDEYISKYAIGWKYSRLNRVAIAIMRVAMYEILYMQDIPIAAAAWSAGRLELLDRPMLAWHLSGGTTELLYVEPDGVNVRAQCVGGTSDISAGQLIDRTGVLLGLPFPAGKALDVLASESDLIRGFPVKLNDLTFSLSGMENKVKALAEQGKPPAEIARFTLETVASAVRRATDAARKRWPGLPVLCSGGVASNRLLRTVMSDAAFAAPQYSTDNAMGAAILAWRSLRQEAEA